MDFSAVEDWLWCLNIAGNIAVIVTLLARRLAGVYALLSFYFLTDLLQSLLALVLLASNASSAVVFQVDAAGQIVKWILSLFFVLQLYGRILAPHPALAKFGRGTVGLLLGASAVVSLLGFLLRPAQFDDPDAVATGFFRMERSMDSGSAMLLLLMSVFLLWYPVKVRRNFAAYMAGFIVYFVAHWAELQAMDLWRQYTRELSAAMLAIALACMLFWIMSLRPEGEAEVTVTGHRWNPGEAERLNLQLDGINTRLARLFRSNSR